MEDEEKEEKTPEPTEQSALPDKGQCPFCSKRKRKNLQRHIQNKHPDGKKVVKQDKKFDDSDPLVCEYCKKRPKGVNNPTKLQKHIDKKHAAQKYGINEPKRKNRKLRKADKYADYEAQFAIFPVIRVLTKGFNGARALYKEKQEALKTLFGADEVELIEVRMVGFDDDDLETAEDPVTDAKPEEGESEEAEADE